MDRASGSGVFARDADALIDLIELEVTEAMWRLEENRAICKVYADAIRKTHMDYYMENVGQDDLLSAAQMQQHAENALARWELQQIQSNIETAKTDSRRKSAWRLEGTLREFPKFDSVDVWFDYPTHQVDTSGIMKDLEPEGEMSSWGKKGNSAKKTPEETAERKANELEIVFSEIEEQADGEPVTLNDLEDDIRVSRNTLKKIIRQHKGFKILSEVGKKNILVRKNDDPVNPVKNR